jgi:hypothetical protein
MGLAQFQRVMDDYLVRYTKRRTQCSREGLTPHEKFYAPKLALSA